MDENCDGTISKQELSKYIHKNSRFWAMLSVNLNLPEQQCRTIATDVAYELAKRTVTRNKNLDRDTHPTPTPPNASPLPDNTSAEEESREPTVAEVQSFLNSMKDPKAEQEFFHRTVFRAFDQDSNGYLDFTELDKFLDVFYDAGSIFAGDARLPSKDELRDRVWKELDVNGDGRLDFHEIRSLLSGGAQRFTTADATVCGDAQPPQQQSLDCQ